MRLGLALLGMLPAIVLAQQVATVEYFPPSGGGLQGITFGPDGAVWFAETDASKIGRITSAGAITEFPLPTADAEPWPITLGPDGALWFGEFTAGKIGRITTDGAVTEFALPNPYCGPDGITMGPDGALWFAEFNGNNIGRITTDGAITEYPLPTTGSGPLGIAGNGDGVWFAESLSRQIGRITTDGVITEYPLNGVPEGITLGPDGAMWFTDATGQIGRITTAGAISLFPIPTPTGFPMGITEGPDGALWFTEFTSGKIGQITLEGSVTEYPTPGPLEPAGITYGPDHSLWFTSFGIIGQDVFVTADLSVTPANGYFHSKLTFSGTGFAPGETVDVFNFGIGSAMLASGIADGTGSFSATGLAPASAYGSRVFLGVGQTSRRLGTANFSMAPRLILTPSSGPAGSTVTANGYGFGRADSVQLFWVVPPTPLAKATADVHGNITLSITVPAGAAAGVNKLFGRGDITRAVGPGTFTVQ